MHNSIKNLTYIKNKIKDVANIAPIIIAVSKTFEQKDILPLLDYGHQHFGENKVQEAIEKWEKLKNKNHNIKLHLIGKLQTNKVKFCLPLFDYIHSLDNLKLAEKISLQQIKTNFKPKIFIQVNIANEVQKNGIDVSELKDFLEECQKKLNLNIIGLMCIPPNNENTEKYFKEMNELNKKFGLKELSMGMSGDYIEAINHGSTFVRVGSKIFGERN
tara:strand:- start:535 stop:1182 length:648 start_codon:yes stop_codon:yes gene_type:complete